jgi:hypothetical protein
MYLTRGPYRFIDLSDFAKSLVDTNKHVSFPFGLWSAEEIANFSGCHGVSVKMLLNNEYCQKCAGE